MKIRAINQGPSLINNTTIIGSKPLRPKLYRNWLSTKQDETIKRLRQRAKAKGREVEENLDIILKYMKETKLKEISSLLRKLIEIIDEEEQDDASVISEAK